MREVWETNGTVFNAKKSEVSSEYSPKSMIRCQCLTTKMIGKNLEIRVYKNVSMWFMNDP